MTSRHCEFGPAEVIDDFREEVSKYPPRIVHSTASLLTPFPTSPEQGWFIAQLQKGHSKPLIKASCISTIIISSMPASPFSTILFLFSSFKSFISFYMGVKKLAQRKVLPDCTKEINFFDSEFLDQLLFSTWVHS